MFYLTECGLTRLDGDSEGVFQVEALLRYAVGKNRQNGVLFGYRYKEAEFEDERLKEDYIQRTDRGFQLQILTTRLVYRGIRYMRYAH